MKKITGLTKHWEFILLMILVAEFVIFTLANPKFLRPVSIMSSVTNYISICIIALFVTFVMITGGIDIQAASIIGLTSITIGVLWSDADLSIWGAVVCAIILSGICGALSGFFVAYCGVQPMVVTLGGSFLYSGIALLISSLSKTPAYQGISKFPLKTQDGRFVGFRFLGKGEVFGFLPMPIFIYIILIVICYFLLHKTKYGRQVFLVGVNAEAAKYSGINTRLIIMSTYILSALGASVAGILLTSNVDSAKYDIGSTFTLSIITAVVLGGTLSTGGKGSIAGTALASLIICILRYGLPLCFGISTQNLDLPVGLMLIVVVVGRAMAQKGLFQKVFRDRALKYRN
ncbi:MAG: ABC transporter permease [Lachnospiraceae bacterium]|nr:ABC transporter permease [Lachnospiraceae bacterium]